MTEQCNKETEVFSRVVGYYQPIGQWNHGKMAEFFDRRTFDIRKSFVSVDKVSKAEELYK